MIKSIFVRHTAHFLSTDPKYCISTRLTKSGVPSAHKVQIFSLSISSFTSSCCTCSPVVCITPFFTVARPGQLSTTHFQIFYTFFLTVSHVQLSIVFKFIPRITLVHAYIRRFVYALSYITAVVGYHHHLQSKIK